MNFQMDIRVAFKENVVSSPTWEHNHIPLKSNFLQQLSGSFAKAPKAAVVYGAGRKPPFIRFGFVLLCITQETKLV